MEDDDQDLWDHRDATQDFSRQLMDLYREYLANSDPPVEVTFENFMGWVFIENPKF